MSLGYDDYVRSKIAMIKEQLGASEVAYDLAGVDLIFPDHTLLISMAAISAMSMLMRNAEEQAINMLRAADEERALRRIVRDVQVAPEQVHG